MTMNLPIVALAFTPDGAFIAGATSQRILIWKVGDHNMPRASWSRLPHPDWFSPRVNPDSDEEDEHCLGWDATGHKLAYGVNSRVSHSTSTSLHNCSQCYSLPLSAFGDDLSSYTTIIESTDKLPNPVVCIIIGDRGRYL